MKKKMVALLLASFMAFSITACGGNDTSEEAQAETNTEESTESAETEGSEQEAAEEEPAEEPAQEDDGIINFDGTGYNVTYVKHETGTDYEGNPCLYYYYTFTNNGEENASAATTAYIQCFQNGVQCQSAITTESNDSINNYMMEVQPGGSAEVCQVYSLSDNSDVTIEASDLISFDDNKDTQVIKLQ